MTIEVYQDKAGEWRWRIVAGNGRTVADSAEGYTERSHAKHAAAHLRLSIGSGTPIVEVES